MKYSQFLILIQTDLRPLYLLMGLSFVYSFCLLFTESLLKPGTALGFEGIMMNGNSVLDSPELTGGRNKQSNAETEKNKLTTAGSAVKSSM